MKTCCKHLTVFLGKIYIVLIEDRNFYNLKTSINQYKGGDKVNKGHKEGKLGDLYWGSSTICTKVVGCYLQNTELSEWHL